MENKYTTKHFPSPYFLFICLFFCFSFASESNTAELPDNTHPIGKYLESIKHWDYEKLDTAVFQLRTYLQEAHPESIVWLEKNSDKNANFQYLLAVMESESYWPDDPRRDNDRITQRLQAAAQQGHSSALYLLGIRAWQNNLADEAFDYLSRAFYVGYYMTLADLHIFFGNTHQKQIKEMEHYVRNLKDIDFDQLYQLIDVYWIHLENEKNANYYFQCAEQNATTADKYRLSISHGWLYEEPCSTKVIDYAGESLLAGSVPALITFQNIANRCKEQPAVQEILQQGLQKIEQQTDAHIIELKKKTKQTNHNALELLEHIETFYSLASFYLKEDVSLKNLEKAEYYYQQMLNLGDNQAFGSLGDLWYKARNSFNYNEGFSKKNSSEYCKKAQSYFEKGSEHNDLHSMRQLVNFYLNNECINKDETKAMSYQERLVSLVKEYGDVSHLEFMIDDLNHLEYFSQAKKYAQQLADKNYHPIMPELARLWLTDKDGLHIDKEKAQFWYEKYLDHSAKMMPDDLIANSYFDAGVDFENAGFDDIADAYFKRAQEILQ